MKVAIHFVDGEVMQGISDAANLAKMGFPVSFEGGNNQIAWVSLAQIKYVIFEGTAFETGSEEDPRAVQGSVKLVLHFADGEIMRSYKDDTFGQDGEGFNLRIWDPQAHSLYRVIVSLHALKAIFFVNEWDSRSDGERQQFGTAEAPAAAAQLAPSPAPQPFPPEAAE